MTTPNPLIEPDAADPLIALEAEMLAADKVHNAAHLAWDADDQNAELLERRDSAMKRWQAVMNDVATTPASTLQGVAVKLRRLVKDEPVGTTGFEADLLRTCLEGVDRLAGKAPPHASEEKLIALYERWRALLDEHLRLDEATCDMPEPEIDAAYLKMNECVDEADKMGGRIVALPATTHHTLTMKLKVILNATDGRAEGPAPARWPQHERTVGDGLRGVIADLERLA